MVRESMVVVVVWTVGEGRVGRCRLLLGVELGVGLLRFGQTATATGTSRSVVLDSFCIMLTTPGSRNDMIGDRFGVTCRPQIDSQGSDIGAR